ncbi:Bifunctional purine biosynthesis protein PurH [Rubrobacter xylanophilus DSM 9941]|uniref:bifunctional phosphoribosylaminoimidazolecarboxamide formyltransferase/IMP cyclohydrolase n=1 Tax=Rubrobacter xylanophilus TaxID=49319 RepID=UPI001C641608|nr:bifunctional phosphoribosylaminoimidazolecarboxamide formyltransferase/IMP cyclohydrolase [Rubrobacter xylanophilus]QYJ17221.1 Bifunctional purine biosynthesis protein PurH [Rubrobacter xylanophilus DSM 9941]
MRRRALISVSDKSGVVDFARCLVELGFEIISTGGTARALEEGGVEVTPVSEVTGEPEILGGRVKTLHPKVHGGILADRRREDHLRQLEERGIAPIDLVCIDLYPFERAVAGGAGEDEAVEQIDIGGPAMLRAAAKNFHSVVVVPGPGFYGEVLSGLRSGGVPEKTRRRLAAAAFERTALYDAAISRWMADGEEFPEVLVRAYRRVLPLRYGENPHQGAAYYAEEGSPSHLLSGVRRLQGKQLSFNNLYDVDAARSLLATLGEGPAAVIVKHANPCGAAVGETVEEAYRRALDSDRVSAFGGIVALNREVDGALARRISEVFTEVLAAPGFTPEAREVFAGREAMILLEAGPLGAPPLHAKYVTGGMLLQETDAVAREDAAGYETVAGKPPSGETLRDLFLAWRVAARVRSNAVVLVRDGGTVGIGAGQMSRVDAARIAVGKAGDRSRGAVAASDAFFPFADGVEVLADAGVVAVIQPGGSRRDEEVTEVARRRGMTMVFTGRRHFLH